MNKKLIFGAFVLVVSMINPACEHGKVDGRQLYIKYMKAHIKK